ncbi:unnamed protein product [Brassica napus]|uniref:(rape) hypothetical protein n=1 Tax=Brassica napus TaxID=3708 RepID=A0A816VTG7_BRANA|nr:unnamed protein product [Brassica napus]
MSELMELSVSPLIPSLPDDVTLDIVARVPRSHYPTLSLVSKKFRKLIASPKLYKRRSQLGITQHRLYAFLRNRNTGDCRFYILHRKLNSRNRLVIVRSLPPVSYRGSFVSVGSKVYVFNDVDALCIDCASHTAQAIPDMPQRFSATPMPSKVANVIDGKVYLIGDSRFTSDHGMSWRKTVMVLDSETQVWEPVMMKEDMWVGALWSDAVVLEDKICMKGHRNANSFVYEPKEKKWELMDEDTHINHMSENMKQSPEMLLSPLIPSLPDDVTIDIVARVPRSHYPTLSLVSKSFRNLIASSKLYKRRSQLGITQRRLYAVLRNRNTGEFSFYVLHRKLNGYNRLVVVRSLPFMSSRGSCVSVGSKVYVFNDLSVLSFDCTSHTVQRGPNFPQRMSYKEVNVIGKKVYVIGDAFCHYVQGTGWMKVWQKAVTVFDTETESLEPKLVHEDMAVGVGPFWSDSVVLEDKIYLKGYMNGNSFVYGPEEREWELMDEIAFLRLK